MADQKLTALTEDTAPASTDYAYTVKDPGGTPLSRRATWLNILKGAYLGIATSDNDIIARIGGAATRVPVAASRIVGRKASGDVTALTSAEVAAMLPGTILNTTYYAAGSDGATFTSTSTTLVDVDATNLSVTFTVPPSGKVVVRMSGLCREAGGNNVYLGVRSGSSTVSGTEATGMSGASFSRPNYQVEVSGLTPGDSLTYKMAYRCDAGTAAIWTGPTRGKAWIQILVG